MRSLRSIRCSRRSSVATGSSTATTSSRPCATSASETSPSILVELEVRTPLGPGVTAIGYRSFSLFPAGGRTTRVSGGGPTPSSIRGVPAGAPPSSELSTFPVSSVLRALCRVTVGPAPGTASPIAPLSA